MHLLFGNCEHVSLRHVVFDPEVAVVENARVIKGVFFWEEVTHQLTVLTLLWGVRKVLNHQRSLYRVLSQLPGHLILEDECQFGAGGVEQYLMDHVVGALAVLDRTIEKDCEQYEHERQHDRVTLIEGVLFDPVV